MLLETEEYSIMIRGSIYQEAITLINNRASKIHKEKTYRIKGRNQLNNVVGDLITTFSIRE
jgi:hypothetical protein